VAPAVIHWTGPNMPELDEAALLKGALRHERNIKVTVEVRGDERHVIEAFDERPWHWDDKLDRYWCAVPPLLRRLVRRLK
jgi:hypothetical protein